MIELKCSGEGCEVVLGLASKQVDGMVCEAHVPIYVPEPSAEEKIAALEAQVAALAEVTGATWISSSSLSSLSK